MPTAKTVKTAVAEWTAEVLAAKTLGKTQAKAVLHADKINPGLRERMLAEVNTPS